MYCIVLYCIVLYCIVLYCIVLYCSVWYLIVMYCFVLYCVIFHGIVLYLVCGMVWYGIVLVCIVLIVLRIVSELIMGALRSWPTRTAEMELFWQQEFPNTTSKPPQVERHLNISAEINTIAINLVIDLPTQVRCSVFRMGFVSLPFPQSFAFSR